MQTREYIICADGVELTRHSTMDDATHTALMLSEMFPDTDYTIERSDYSERKETEWK